jgi:hypothetical protein
VRAEAWDKRYRALSTVEGDATATTTGEARGVELQARWSPFATTALRSSVTVARSRIDSPAHGAQVSALHEVPVSVFLSLEQELPASHRVGLALRIASGRRLLHAGDSGDPLAVTSYPAQFRLDVSWSWVRQSATGRLAVLYATVGNLTGRRNLNTVTRSAAGQATVVPGVLGRTLFFGATIGWEFP